MYRSELYGPEDLDTSVIRWEQACMDSGLSLTHIIGMDSGLFNMCVCLFPAIYPQSVEES